VETVDRLDSERCQPYLSRDEWAINDSML